MKTLDKKASEILRGLLALQTTKVDRSDGTYMPVHIEIIEKTDKYDHISLAHYGQQNGDAMRDPEMIIALHKESQQFIPYYYRNGLYGYGTVQRKMDKRGHFAEPSFTGRPHDIR